MVYCIAAQHSGKDADRWPPTQTDTKPASLSNAPRETMTITDNSTGKSIEMPLLSGTVGPKVMDIRSLYTDLGVFTFDPGYTATGSCESKITYIDGDEGVLLYRGYPIEELAEHSDFMEVSLSPALWRAADRRAEGEIRARHHPPHHGARAAHRVLSRLPPRRASDGGDVRRGRRALGLLSRFDRHLRSAPAHGRVATG